MWGSKEMGLCPPFCLPPSPIQASLPPLRQGTAKSLPAEPLRSHVCIPGGSLQDRTPHTESLNGGPSHVAESCRAGLWPSPSYSSSGCSGCLWRVTHAHSPPLILPQQLFSTPTPQGASCCPQGLWHSRAGSGCAAQRPLGAALTGEAKAGQRSCSPSWSRRTNISHQHSPSNRGPLYFPPPNSGGGCVVLLQLR